jgi:hypothetical protein
MRFCHRLFLLVLTLTLFLPVVTANAKPASIISIYREEDYVRRCTLYHS